MTCIVAYKTEHGIWVGSDSFVHGGDGLKQFSIKPKWVKFDHFLIAGAGSLFILNFLESLLEVSELKKFNPSTYRKTTKLCDMLKQIMIEDSICTPSSNNSALGFSGSLLIVTKNKIYDVDGTFGFLEIKDFCASGSGTPYAYGAYHTVDKTLLPKEVVKKCLEAAGHYDAYCGGPLHIEQYSKDLGGSE